MGIQPMLLRDGKESRVFRNAVTFSSHMFKFQDYNNPWGDESHNEINMDDYIRHHFNNIIHKTHIPIELSM